jgi:hypothetical protein
MKNKEETEGKERMIAREGKYKRRGIRNERIKITK